MNKTAIRNYAIWARKALLEGVKQKAYAYGITERTVTTGTGGDSPDVEGAAVTADGRMLTAVEKSQRTELLREIRRKGYEQVMEQAAYTWFNRFIALRFMEVNGYLPSQVRVFTDGSGQFHPDILQEAMTVEIPGLDREKVLDYLDRQDNEGLYQYLLLTQCNALHEMLPLMFETIDSYTELLFPVGLLQEGSVLSHLVTDIPEADWDVQTLDENGTPQGQVEIIGWLYQYYNTELKEDTFAKLKKNVKISRERIPCATQLFTPDWIVRYMVENSLGRLWIEGHPEDANLKENWKYYLEEAEQEPAIEAQLAAIRAEYRTLRPQDIRLVDPCMGSGHILVYAFEVLMQIYVSQGYAPRDAVQSILENNLYGLDIDDRAAQLAYFAVMMKARQYDRRILTRKVQPHVYAIAESNGINISDRDREKLGPERTIAEKLLKELHDAKEYGSILKLSLPLEDLRTLRRRLQTLAEAAGEGDLLERAETMKLCDELLPLVEVAEVLVQTYHVVVTNPPYMGAGNMNGKLSQFMKEHYAAYKSDFFSAFMVRASEMTQRCGYCGFFTPYVWMFIQSYESLRHLLCERKTIETLIQFEYSAFEEATVPVCTFVFCNHHTNKKGCYLRLTDFRGGMEVQRQKTIEAIGNHDCGYYYEASADNFSKIPGSPVAYWVSEKLTKAFDNPKIGDFGVAKVGIGTGDTDRFLKLWYEVEFESISFNKDQDEIDSIHFAPINKGGHFRKWYGNNEYVINWINNGLEICVFKDEDGRRASRVQNVAYQLRESLTWGDVTSGGFSMRISNKGFFFSDVGNSLFLNEQDLNFYFLAFCNSTVFSSMKKLINQTMHFKPGNMIEIPIIITEKEHENKIIDTFASENILLSRTDWDSYETSWDFKRHPLI